MTAMAAEGLLNKVYGETTQTPLDEVTADGASDVIDLGQLVNHYTMQLVVTGSPTDGTVTLEGPLNGTDFSALLTTPVSGGNTFDSDFGTLIRYLRTSLAGLAGGTDPTVTAHVAAIRS